MAAEDPETKKQKTMGNKCGKTDDTQGELVLGYWGIRGLAAPCRMMLMYKDVKFTSKIYSSPEDWFAKDKPRLQEKNAFANLPYLIDEQGNVITQSNAVILAIGRRTGLNGTTEDEIRKNEMTLFQIFDMHMDAAKVVYAERDQANVDKHFDDTVTTHYNKFEGFLKQTEADFFGGKEPLSADFHVFEVIDLHERWAKFEKKDSPLGKYPLLKGFYERFLGLEKMQEYLNSYLHKQLTINAPIAPTFVGEPPKEEPAGA